MLSSRISSSSYKVVSQLRGVWQVYSARRNVKRFGWSWNKKPRGARKRRRASRAGGRGKRKKWLTWKCETRGRSSSLRWNQILETGRIVEAWWCCNMMLRSNALDQKLSLCATMQDLEVVRWRWCGWCAHIFGSCARVSCLFMSGWCSIRCLHEHFLNYFWLGNKLKREFFC